MPRPTIAQQIAKAAEAGDLEKVKELSQKLAAKEKVTPKTKPKSKSKSKAKVVVDDDQIEDYEPEDIDEDDKIDESDGFTVKARRSHYGEDVQSETYIDEDGKKRTRCRQVPFKTIKNRKNKWKDNLNEYQGDIELDKKLHKNGVHRGEHREAVKKVRVTCKQCGDKKVVWPGEIKHSNWICDECIIGSIPKG